METPAVEVETSSGKLRGRRQNGIETFCGVPYAAAPIGSHRFKAPRPIPHWAGVRDAIEPGPICPQTPSRLRFAMGDFVARQDEDCLHVTIWTPRADSSRRPVLVWLHGGAYMSGAGAIDWYSGETLAREGDLVVVESTTELAHLAFSIDRIGRPEMLDSSISRQRSNGSAITSLHSVVSPAMSPYGANQPALRR